MFKLFKIENGKAHLNDEAPLTWSKGLIREWARQRLESGVSVMVINSTTKEVVFEETCN